MVVESPFRRETVARAAVNALWPLEKPDYPVDITVGPANGQAVAFKDGVLHISEEVDLAELPGLIRGQWREVLAYKAQARDRRGRFARGGGSGTLYHGTSAENVQKILSKGIDVGQGKRNWDYSERGKVYLTKDLERVAIPFGALAAFKNTGKGVGAKFAVLEVKLPDKERGKLIEDEHLAGMGMDSFTFSGKIDASYISGVRFYETTQYKPGAQIEAKLLSHSSTKALAETGVLYVPVSLEVAKKLTLLDLLEGLKQFGSKQLPPDVPPPDRDAVEEHMAAVLEKALAALRRRVEARLREIEVESSKEQHIWVGLVAIRVGRKQLPPSLLNLPDDLEFWTTAKEGFLADLARADPPVGASTLMNSGGAEAASLGLAVDFSLVNEQALATAAKYTNEWWQALEGSTRDGLRTAIQSNIATGAPLRGLIKDIEPLFGKGRASAIAATETTRLYAEGNRFAYASAGIQIVEWRSVKDARVDPLCDELDGQRWQLGHEQYVPPRHVSCRCRLVPVVDDAALEHPTDLDWDPANDAASRRKFQKQGNLYNNEESTRLKLADKIDRDPRRPVPSLAETMKADVQKRISARSGLSARRTDEFIKTWAITSSDNSLDSVALQHVAGEKFKATPTRFIQEKIEFYKQYDKVVWGETVAEATKFLDAVYAETQEMLARWGVTELYLGRGMGGPEFEDLDEVVAFGRHKIQATANAPSGELARTQANYSEPIDFQSNPLSSWSTNDGTFSTWGPYAVVAKIPASRIISTSFTGFGCLNEYEFIVVGGLDTIRLFQAPRPAIFSE
jgi:SPP1 gp7 family putative phage head morphogenesis protein